MTQDKIDADAAEKMADWIATQPGTLFLSASKRLLVSQAFIAQLAKYNYVLSVKSFVGSSAISPEANWHEAFKTE